MSSCAKRLLVQRGINWQKKGYYIDNKENLFLCWKTTKLHITFELDNYIEYWRLVSYEYRWRWYTSFRMQMRIKSQTTIKQLISVIINCNRITAKSCLSSRDKRLLAQLWTKSTDTVKVSKVNYTSCNRKAIITHFAKRMCFPEPYQVRSLIWQSQCKCYARLKPITINIHLSSSPNYTYNCQAWQNIEWQLKIIHIPSVNSISIMHARHHT